MRVLTTVTAGAIAVASGTLRSSAVSAERPRGRPSKRASFGGVLLLEPGGPGGVPARRPRFTWAGDMMRMEATFFGQGAETRYTATLVRRP
jgi:hypothetical protein